MTDSENPPARARKSRRRWWIAGTAVVLVAAGAAAGIAATAPSSPAENRGETAVATVPITTGDMVSVTTIAGALQFSNSQPVVAGLDGVITELPKPGDTVAPGGALYRVNTVPVVLMAGAMPAWRDFAPGMTAGDDVKQLQQNLAAFGHFAGAPDGKYGRATAQAVSRWQKSIGLPATGTLGHKSILFAEHPLRVDTVQARRGLEVGVGTPLYDATSADQIVALDVTSSDREVAVIGAEVTVVLPSGAETPGVIAEAGAPVTRGATDSKPASVVIPVRISIADQAALADFVRANVTVRFSSTLTEGVLTVPVEALVPIDDASFAVEIARAGSDGGPSKVPVTVGQFGSGRVEISGDGIADGVEVVVPKL